jgi:hypothetical protein
LENTFTYYNEFPLYYQKCSYGLGVRVEYSQPKGDVSSIPLCSSSIEWGYDRKIPAWWENSGRGDKKAAGKNSGMVGNFNQVETKRLPGYGNLFNAAPVI